MGRQELLDYLLKEIEKCGFEIFAVDTFPIAAVVNVDNKIMVYNFKDASPFGMIRQVTACVIGLELTEPLFMSQIKYLFCL